MTFIDAYKDMWRHYAQFDGRTSVGGYWRVLGLEFLTYIVVFFTAIVGILAGAGVLVVSLAAAFLIYSLATVVPHLALIVRRLHDTDKPGWMMLIGLVPVVGIWVVIVFLATRGSPASNQFGLPPQPNQWTTGRWVPDGSFVAPASGSPLPPPPPPVSY